MKKQFFKFLATAMVAMIALPVTVLADTEDPSDVTETTATELNGAVMLEWNEATDDTGVEGYFVHYGTTAVTEPGQAYDEFVDAGDNLEFTVDGLENGTTYYFSVVAYDAAGNESEAWGPEVEATPSEDGADPGEGDTDSPQVSEAEALYKESVKVVFSEAVIIPSLDAQDAFAIENDDTFESLEVLAAEMDDKDASGRTVILETVEQEEGATYKLTVGVDVEDIAGNPIISGTSDTAIFEGSGEDEPAEDTEGPKITDIEVLDVENVLISFDESIVLSIDPSQNFEFVANGDDSDTLDVLKVELGDNEANVENASAIVKTTMQTGATYTVTVTGVTDEAGNEIEEGDNTIEFTGLGQGGDEDPGEEPDTEAPKDVAKFMADKIFQAEKYLVTLSWEIPEDTVGDVVEQIIYMSTNGNEYEKEASLNPGVNEYEVGEFEPGDYWFKITQVDEAGNESEGVVTKIVLSETGPELLGLLVFSLGMGRIAGRKKRK